MDWLQMISLVSGLTSVIAFVGVFVKMGKEKGITESTQKEMRKDIDENAKQIVTLDSRVQQIQLENAKLTTMLSNDLGWIKASLSEIKMEIAKKEK